MSKPRARRVTRVDARPSRYAPIPDRVPVTHEEPEMSDYSNPAPAVESEPEFEYGALPVPVVPEAPKPVLSWWRRNKATGEVEYKEVPEMEPGEKMKESREGFLGSGE
jgi:hypothetical protein